MTADAVSFSRLERQFRWNSVQFWKTTSTRLVNTSPIITALPVLCSRLEKRSEGHALNGVHQPDLMKKIDILFGRSNTLIAFIHLFSKPTNMGFDFTWITAHVCCRVGVPLSRNTVTNLGLLVLVGCLTSHQHACVSQGRICSDSLYVLPH